MEKVPTDLRKALAVAKKANAEWNLLTPISRRDFIGWIEGAKQSETRERRIRRTCEMLVEGKRRPCCYSIVPMKFYQALGTNPKAKTAWGSLTPVERRDFVDWMGLAKQPAEQKLRIDKVCRVLAAGKKKV